jgi:DNA polymerase-3 subunit delta
MFESVNQLVNSDITSPIVLLFGEDEFSREEAQNALLNKYVATEDDKFNFDIFDGENASLNVIADLCRSYPMMSDKRVVMVKRFEKLFTGRTSKKIETSSPISSYLKNPSLDTKLILIAEIDSAKDIYKTYKSNDKDKFNKKISSLKFPFNILISQYAWMEFPRVYESEYPRWTRERFKLKGKNIQPEAVEIMLSKTKQSLRDINNEVDKLSLALPGKKDITLDDINFLTGSTREYNVFELQKAIAARDLSKSIMIINKILSTDRQEMLIIAIISKFFINLLKVIEDFKSNVSPQVLASKLGISPFQFNDYQIALKKYNINDIENSIVSLCSTDLNLKSANSDSLLIMQKLLYSIMDIKVENTPLL